MAKRGNRMSTVNVDIKNMSGIEEGKPTGFKEDFSEPVLSPQWQEIAGIGRSSLTDNPGYLRYYLEGRGAGGWMTNYKAGSWMPSQTIIRPFKGSDWILKTKATYNIHACSNANVLKNGSTGAQYQRLYIAFGEENNNYLLIRRGVDWWYGDNIRSFAYLTSNGVQIAECEFLAPDDVIKQEASGGWFRHTYFYEVVKDGQEISFRYSYDGKNYVTGFKVSLTKPVEATQRVIMDANVWATAGSYVDWDYLHVQPICFECLPVMDIMGVGKVYSEKLEAHGVNTIADMISVDVSTLGEKTGISLYKLYMWKRRAALAMDVKIDQDLFSDIQKMELGDIIILSDEELSSKAHQPIEIIPDLKKDISGLFISLDNDIVKSMTIESLA